MNFIEAFERIKDITSYVDMGCSDILRNDPYYREEVKCIDEALKALQIIKETPIFAWYITIYKDAYEMVTDAKGFRINDSVEELQEKFDLLKKVLL